MELKFNSFKTLTGHSKKVNCLIQLTDTYVASGSNDKTIKIWDYNNCQCIFTLEGHESEIICINIYDKKTICSLDKKGKIIFWNFKTGLILNKLDSSISVS